MQIPKVPKPQAQKINQQQVYPCPCPRRRGKLKPIALTDAFGCDRCSSIFTIEEDGYSLVQLGGIDPYRKVWHWSGAKWQAARDFSKKDTSEFIPTPLLLISAAIPLLLLAPYMEPSLGLPLAIVIVALLVLIAWWLLLLRHRDS